MNIITKTINTSQNKSLNNVKIFSVIIFLCVLFLATVFIFNDFLTSSPFITTSTVFVNDGVATNRSEKTATSTKLLSQNDDAVIDAINTSARMSESEFRQEAQNLVFLDVEEKPSEKLQAHAMRVNASLSNDDFRVEAENVLYREEN